MLLFIYPDTSQIRHQAAPDSPAAAPVLLLWETDSPGIAGLLQKRGMVGGGGDLQTVVKEEEYRGCGN